MLSSEHTYRPMRAREVTQLFYKVIYRYATHGLVCFPIILMSETVKDLNGES